MYKLLSIIIAGLFLSSSVLAQSVQEGQQPFRKKESANALYTTIEGQQKNIQHLLEQKFNSKSGKKSKNDKGVRVFESARVADISSSSMNYYYDVEKVKGQENMCNVRLFIATGPNNFLNSDENPGEMLSAREIMENLQYETKVYEFELAVAEQTQILAKATKEYDGLVRDSVKLLKRYEETLAAIEKNKTDRADQLIQMEEDQKRLEALKEEMEAYISREQDWRTRGEKNDR
ncbi:MAG: hypothetical protein AAF694_09180 [Bacteroidota bacterium]